MLHTKKILFIIIGIVLLIGIVLTVYFFEQSKPKNVIESKLNLNLPTSSRIVNYEYHRDSKNFAAKISIEDKSVRVVKKQLDNFFGGATSSENMKSATGFKNAVSWWDMDDKNIEAGYMNFIDVKKWWNTIMPHQVWAFITKDKDGQYYLYIFY